LKAVFQLSTVPRAKKATAQTGAKAATKATTVAANHTVEKEAAEDIAVTATKATEATEVRRGPTTTIGLRSEKQRGSEPIKPTAGSAIQ